MNALRGLEHLYRRALHALRSHLSRTLFAQDRDTQIPNLVVDLAEGFLGKFVRWCEPFLESRDVFQARSI